MPTRRHQFMGPAMPSLSTREDHGETEKRSKILTLRWSRREMHMLILGTPWLLPLDFSVHTHRKLEPHSNLRVSSIGLGPEMGAWCRAHVASSFLGVCQSIALFQCFVGGCDSKRQSACVGKQLWLSASDTPFCKVIGHAAVSS